MKYRLTHQTKYTYQSSVENYQSILCLHPLTLDFQSCEYFNLLIEPKPRKIFERKDIWGNTQYYFSIHEPHKELLVTSTSTMHVFRKPVYEINTFTCDEVFNQLKNNIALKNNLLPFLLPSQFVYWDDDIKNLALKLYNPSEYFFNFLKKLNQYIFTNFEFKAGFSTVNTPLKTILKEKKGVCQDFSHLTIACLRSLGFAARYVSGYLETFPPKGSQKLKGSDASHAWISVYMPDYGWLEFDPTNNLIPSDNHIVTAYGRDYADIVPIKGIIFSTGEHEVDVKVDVTPIIF